MDDIAQLYMIGFVVVGPLSSIVVAISCGWEALKRGDFKDFSDEFFGSVVSGIFAGIFWPAVIVAAACYALMYMLFWPLSKLAQYIEIRRNS